MNLLLLQLIFISTISAESTADEGTGTENDAEPGQHDLSRLETTGIKRLIKTNDSFWSNPIVHYPPWMSPDQDLGPARYPFYDPSYPIWVPGWKKPDYKVTVHNLAATTSSDETLSQQQLNDAIGSSEYDQKLYDARGKKEEYDSNKMDAAERKQYRAELKAGDMTQLFGTNQHRYQPAQYRIYDLGRRFVPQYPYQEVKQNNRMTSFEDDDDPDLIPLRESLNNHMASSQGDDDPSLLPLRAPPELVLAIANESALIQAAQPVDPDEYLLKKESLRTGNYWNSYWKEEVEDPSNALRSPKRSQLDTVAANLSPGTPIYEYVSKLNKLYPKLLYVINKTK